MIQTHQTYSHKTQPSILRNVVTSASQRTADEEVTQKLSIADIVLPANNKSFNSPQRLPCVIAVENEEPNGNSSIEFAYEQQRLQELGENVHKFQESGPHSEVDPQDPRVGHLINHHKAVIESEDDEIENWGNLVKIISVISLGLSLLLILFSLVYAFVVVLKVKVKLLLCILPLAVCISESTWMIHLSIVGSRTSGLADHESLLFTRFFKLGFSSILVLILQLGVMSIIKPIPEVFACLGDILNQSEDYKSEGYFAIGYLILWCMCIIDVSLIGLSATFGILLRRHLRSRAMYVLQYNTLPLGYQVFSQFKKEQEGIA